MIEVRTPDVARQLQGQRAGLVTRLSADVIDGIVIAILWVGGLAMLGLFRFMVRPVGGLHLPRPSPWLTLSVLGVLCVAYLTSGWATRGRTIGKRVAGLRVVTQSGSQLGLGLAVLRAFLCTIFPIALFWVLASRRNASGQDVLLHTAVVYDWGLRPARPT